MEAFVGRLVEALLSGGPGGLIAALVLLSGGMACLLYKRESDIQRERRDLIDLFQATINKDRDDLLEVIDKYQAGQLSVVQALAEIRTLITMVGRGERS